MFLENKFFDQHKNKDIIGNRESASKVQVNKLWPFIKAKDINPRVKVVKGRSHPGSKQCPGILKMQERVL